MDIDRRGREWAHWPVVQAPAGETLEVTFDDGQTWHELERDGDVVRILVAGPEAPANPDGTAVLGLGRNAATIRVVANPEILVRKPGTITVR